MNRGLHGGAFMKGTREPAAPSKPFDHRVKPAETSQKDSSSRTEEPSPTQPDDVTYYYADAAGRVVAYLIDSVLVSLIVFLVAALVWGVAGPTVALDPGADILDERFTVNRGLSVVNTLVAVVLSAVYFVGSWLRLGGSPGQRMLGMLVARADDGSRLTVRQGVSRWVFLGAPLWVAPALTEGLPTFNSLLLTATVAWYLVLVVTIARSATKQGLHDRVANSVVVRRGRAALLPALRHR